jgi:predicted site-specific integrase-resolvase
MKLSAWAKSQGIPYKSAHRWFQSGHLPVPAKQMPTGMIIVYPDDSPAGQDNSVALYARVSSSDQKPDLDRQLARLVEWANAQHLPVTHSVSEVGSGMNGKRPRLLKLLADRSIKTIVVEHRDRLARFGFEYIEAALASAGKRIMVVDDTEIGSDLVRDMVEVLTSFCARLYGKRSATQRAKAAVTAMERA